MHIYGEAGLPDRMLQSVCPGLRPPSNEPAADHVCAASSLLAHAMLGIAGHLETQLVRAWGRPGAASACSF